MGEEVLNLRHSEEDPLRKAGPCGQRSALLYVPEGALVEPKTGLGASGNSGRGTRSEDI